MRRRHLFRFPFHDQPLHHWRDMKALHNAIQKIPNHFRGFMLELAEGPLSRHEAKIRWQRLCRGSIHSSSRRPTGPKRWLGAGHGQHRRRDPGDLIDHLKQAQDMGLLVTDEDPIALTPAGKELVWHIQQIIPYFVDRLFAPGTATKAGLVLHVLLSVAKLTFGLLSGSAGLLADGIDNTVDTGSSALVWLGLKFDRERLTSIFIVMMMFVSLIGVGLATHGKLSAPGPLEQGWQALIVSAGAGVLMLVLSAYQYVVGSRHGNFAILCQSVDSRNHVLTSGLVCGGIVLSFAAQRWNAFWLYYADGAASLVIGALILRSAVELARELIRPSEGQPQINHFVARAQERMRNKLIWDWLQSELRQGARSLPELTAAFTREFCEGVPRIFVLTRMDFRPSTIGSLTEALDRFVRQGTIHREGDRFSLARR